MKHERKAPDIVFTTLREELLIVLMPLYARNPPPSTVAIRTLGGGPAMIALPLGHNQVHTSPLMQAIVARIGELENATGANPLQ